jgi:omega-6 fatty acid desaturase (delta-12 desaturase)
MAQSSTQTRQKTRARPPEAVRLRAAREYLTTMTLARSIIKGVALVVVTGSICAATWTGIFYTDSWLLKTLLGYFNGLAIGMIFLVGHDACHQSLTPVSWLNKLLGRICFLPPLHPYTAWEYSHNALHHGRTNLKTHDPGYAPLTVEEYRALPRWRRWMHRFYRTNLGLSLYYLLENWVPQEMFPSKAHQAKMRSERTFRRDRRLVATYGIVMIVATVWLGVAIRPAGNSAWIAGLGHFLVGWLWPYLVWNGAIGFITFQQHTHPKVRWFDNEADWTFYETQVRGTVHIQFPWLMRMMFHNINEHTAHHINPRVPLYELKAAQDRMRELLADDVLVVNWRPRVTLDTLRRCKLYDFQNHRWLDFNGRPTTERMKVERHAPVAVG